MLAALSPMALLLFSGLFRQTVSKSRATSIAKVALAVLVLFLFSISGIAEFDVGLSERLASGYRIFSSGVSSDANAQGRVSVWLSAIDVYSESPFGTWGPPQLVFGVAPDNEWVSLLLQGGAVYVLTLLIPLVMIIAKGMRRSASRRERTMADLAMVCGVAAVSMPAFLSTPAFLFWFFVGTRREQSDLKQ